MKIQSQQVGTGKLGNAVYAKVAGECIAREYRPEISNPSTEGQVEQRSKFKLMSQLSAALKPSLAIRKEGLKSARNIFSSINAKLATINDGVAQINLNKVQITKSTRGLADFIADRTSGSKVVVALSEDFATNLDSVVYAAFTKQQDGSLVDFDSIKIDAAGADGTFEGELKYTDKAVVIYAYGLKSTSAKASAAYANMVAPTAEQVAKLIATSSEVANGTQLTMTKGLTMLVGETTGASDNEEHFLVSVSASGNGSVSGGGSFVAGQMATLHATPDAEASFVAWKKDSKNGQVLSTNANYSFEVTQSIVIVGVFEGGPVPHYNISASVDPANSGSVSGTGSKAEDSTCTLTFTPAGGSELVFDGWYENGVKVSAANPYSFTVEGARTLVAKSKEAPQSGFGAVSYNNQSWDRNLSNQADDAPFSAEYEVAGDETHVAFANSLNNPQVGQTVVVMGATAINNGVAAAQVSLSAGETYYLVAGHGLANNSLVIDKIYQYTLSTHDD